MMLCNRLKSQILLIDAQARLVPAVLEPERLTGNLRLLLQAATLLEIPVTVSEQYPKGLGPTVDPVREALPASARIHEKITFSCLADEAIRRSLSEYREEGRNQLILAGAEAHVCVLQSAMDAVSAGYDVVLAADATSSRAQSNIDLALSRLRHAGVTTASTEMIVFEWMERAGTDTFRALSALIK